MMRLGQVVVVVFMAVAMSGPVKADALGEALVAFHNKDYATAFRLFSPLAEQGDARAQNTIGAMYLKGAGVVQDNREAVKWFSKAAEQGDVRGQHNLGIMYNKGLGVAQDYVQAHKWLNIAGANGSEVGRKNRDKLAKKMSPAQIAEAQNLAREWMAKHEK
jgi:uncharacterized protein